MLGRAFQRRPADNEHYQNKHHTWWRERPADKSAGYAYKARLRGLAWVVDMTAILLMFIICVLLPTKPPFRGSRPGSIHLPVRVGGLCLVARRL